MDGASTAAGQDEVPDHTPLLADPSDPATAMLDELRRTEFSRLDSGGHVYLDYTGGGLYAESQLRKHFELLRDGVFGNPHSLNPTSAASTALLERARPRVLDFFRASPDEYVAIVTANATGALRLVGEAYPFRSGDRFLLTFDNSPRSRRRCARSRPNSTSSCFTALVAACACPPRARRWSVQPGRSCERWTTPAPRSAGLSS